jgi:hypothetical protein
VHNCYIKETKSERLTDTIQFKHKNITNPTITPADKIMQALANCKTALQGMINHKSNQEYQELQQLIQQSEQHILQHNDTKKLPPPQTKTTVPRVQEEGRVPRVHKPATMPQPIRIARSRRTRMIPSTPTIHLPNQPPALSTRSRTAAANFNKAPPAANTRNKTRPSRLRQPTDFSKLRRKGQALSVQLQSPSGRHQFMQQCCQMEHEVHDAMAVLDKESEKLLNYRQLLQHPKQGCLPEFFGHSGGYRVQLFTAKIIQVGNG